MDYKIIYNNCRSLINKGTILDITLETEDDNCIYDIYIDSYAVMQKLFYLKFVIKYKYGKNKTISKTCGYKRTNWHNIPKSKIHIVTELIKQFELIFYLSILETGKFQSYKIYKKC